VALRNALSSVAVAARLGREADSADQQRITAANGHPTVAAAKEGLASSGPSITVAWESSSGT